MAAFSLNSFRLCFLSLGLALGVAAAARAGDVSVQLDAATGFAIKNSTGAIQRLRVDEATGNISRNGALFVHTTGTTSTFVGAGAGNLATTGASNTGVGVSSLTANTTGYSNSADGARALLTNTTGNRNAAFGSDALRFSLSGHVNSAFGSDALRANTAGGYNSAFGGGALFSSTTGNFNVAVGYHAGVNQTTGSNNIYLANAGVAAESGQIKIGTAGTHTAAFVAGIRGVTTSIANAIPVLIDGSGQLGTVSSSRRVKKDIRDMGDATDRLLELRPVMFHYKQEQTLPSGGELPPEYGLIAEEVAEVFPDLVVYDDEGQPFTVKYHEMAPMLLNEMKKQRATAQEQQRSIAKLEAQEQTIEAQQREIAALTTRLARVESRVVDAQGLAQR